MKNYLLECPLSICEEREVILKSIMYEPMNLVFEICHYWKSVTKPHEKKVRISEFIF